MRKKKEVPLNTIARGRCVIPLGNIVQLTKVVKRLQSDGIQFEMEDVEDTTWRAIVEIRKDYMAYQTIELRHGPATIVTYGAKL